MLRSLLIGLTSGSRSLTPLATVSVAAQQGALPGLDRRLAWLSEPAVSSGLKLLAAGELGGDKLKGAPNRTVLVGLLARLATGGLAGAALAPRGRILAGAALGAGGAIGAAYVTFAVRKAAMRVFGQTATGLVEDALTVGAARAVVGPLSPPPRR